MKARNLILGAVLVAACDGSTTGTLGVSTNNLPATQLVFTVQPSNVQVNQVIVPAFSVAVQTSTGVTVTGSSAQVTVSLAQGTGTNGAALTGTLTSSAVNGVATFNNVRVNTVGTGYRIVASAPTLSNGTSGTFDVTP